MSVVLFLGRVHLFSYYENIILSLREIRRGELRESNKERRGRNIWVDGWKDKSMTYWQWDTVEELQHKILKTLKCKCKSIQYKTKCSVWYNSMCRLCAKVVIDKMSFFSRNFFKFHILHKIRNFKNLIEKSGSNFFGTINFWQGHVKKSILTMIVLSDFSVRVTLCSICATDRNDNCPELNNPFWFVKESSGWNWPWDVSTWFLHSHW